METLPTSSNCRVIDEEPIYDQAGMFKRYQMKKVVQDHPEMAAQLNLAFPQTSFEHKEGLNKPKDEAKHETLRRPHL